MFRQNDQNKKKRWAIGLGVVTIGSLVSIIGHEVSKTKVIENERSNPINDLKTGHRNQARTNIAQPNAKNQNTINNSGKGESKATSKKRNSNRGWESFAQRFGKDLKPQYTYDGTLVSAWSPGLDDGNPADSAFQVQSDKQVLTRASEVIRSAESLLGLDPAFPLAHPIVNSSPLSAQVYYSETYQGLPVIPGGKVRVDLGKRGELIAIDSSYAASFEVRNEMKMLLSEARLKALSAMKGSSSALVFNERPIVWVAGHQGYYAYEFLISGHSIVIDATEGKVLSKQDRRES